MHLLHILIDDPAAPHNIAAWLLTSVACVAWLQFSEFIASSGLLDSITTRKVVHIGTGLIFMLTWNLFPNTPASRYYAVPLLITTRFGLIGTGVISDIKTVRSMSRSGDPRELLYGPLLYGIIFTVSTVFYWADSPTGIVALVLLCVGDGMAFLMGVKYGTKKLPFNKYKSWIGSFSFFIFSLVAAVFYIALFAHLGWFVVNWSTYAFVLVNITISATLIEALPIKEWDNITVFVICAFGHHLPVLVFVTMTNFPTRNRAILIAKQGNYAHN